MNVYEYAMKVEVEGERYYRDLAQKTDDAGLKQVLTMLADEEVKHFKAFEAMRNNQAIPVEPVVDVFENAKTIFQKLKEEGTCASFDKDQIDFYEHALSLEERSYEFYTQKAAELDNPEQKAAFLRIAEEEQQHKALMENLIEYITHPERWIESAEFNKK